MYTTPTYRLLAALTLAVLSNVTAATEWRDPQQPTMLITGFNASHGLAFVEGYNQLGWDIIATC